MYDTIAAISTSLGVGAISMIRVSGNKSVDIVNKIFKGQDLSKVSSHTINYGHIVDNDKIIDEVLVSIMRSPKTFTAEDMVEINCHGSISTTNKILELLLIKGARIAEPGEFTKRAFLNGRIDLLEAESVMDLINSNSEKSRKLAIEGLKGKISKLIKDIRQKLLEVIATIEVNIDYPEYEDIEQVTHEILSPKIITIRDELLKILRESENGKLIKNGIKTIILGRPNVGKSSILNSFLGEDKAIVTNIAGTTRDTVEGYVILDGISLNIIDTAGIRETKDIIEKIGVDKSIKLINEADLVILVLDNNDILQPEDLNLLSTLQSKNIKYIIAINKNDLPKKIELNNEYKNNTVYCNTKLTNGLDELKDKIRYLFNMNQLETSDLTYLSNARQISLLKEALNSLNMAETGIKEKASIDMIEIDIRTAWLLLGEIIGETYNDDLINQLFSQFCLGK